MSINLFAEPEPLLDRALPLPDGDLDLEPTKAILLLISSFKNCLIPTKTFR